MSALPAPQQTEAVGALWREAMAAQASPTIQKDRVSMDDPVITMLDPRGVVIPPRLRPEDPAHTAALVASVKRDGVRSPIGVNRLGGKLQLIWGLHRLRAAIEAGLYQIPAIITEVSKDEAELLEIEENLIRHDLNALDRAVFVMQWKDVYQRLYPLAGKRGRKLDQLGPIGFSRSGEAKKIGLSKTSIDRAVRRIDRIAADVRPRLAGTDAALKGVVLDALGKLAHEDQREVVALFEDGEAKTIAAAIRQHRQGGAAPAEALSAEDRGFAALMSAWGKHPEPAAVRRFLLKITETDKPPMTAVLPKGWGWLGGEAKKAAAGSKAPKQKDVEA